MPPEIERVVVAEKVSLAEMRPEDGEPMTGRKEKTPAMFGRMVVQLGKAPPKNEHQSLVTEIAGGTSQVGDQLSGQGG